MSQAVVIGGSMAGLCAANVLSRRYDRVLVLDRDAFPECGRGRAGVPQARHAHALLARGLLEIDRMVPGFADRLKAGGAVDVDFGESFLAMRPTGWEARRPVGIRSYWASRDLFEGTVRELVRKTPNVELRERATVDRVSIQRGDRLRATAVEVRRDDGSHDRIEADLVIDASGRASRFSEWIAPLGITPPEEERVDAHAGYCTRWYKRPPREKWPASWSFDGLWIDTIAPEPGYTGVLVPIENDQWLVTMVGMANHHPPGDEEGFVRAMKTLRSPLFAAAVALGEPISEVYRSRSTSSRRRRLDTWKDPIDGLVVMGDAACAFNPIYGQGMTVASMCAAALARSLEAVGADARALPRRHFAEQAKEIEVPWNFACGADFMYPTTEGKRTPFGRLFVPYVKAMLDAALADDVVRLRLYRIFNLLDHPNGMFGLDFMRRVAQTQLTIALRGRSEVPSLPQGITLESSSPDGTATSLKDGEEAPASTSTSA